MPARTTYKVLFYSGEYRLVSGQHDVWCNLPKEARKGVDWNVELACRAHIRKRIDKSTRAGDILALLPRPRLPPTVCKQLVHINHYKFIDGVLDSLQQRSTAYKHLKFVWYKQSHSIMQSLLSNNQRVDIHDSSFDCKRWDAIVRTSICDLIIYVFICIYYVYMYFVYLCIVNIGLNSFCHFEFNYSGCTVYRYTQHST